jgi:hypothetical protein
MDRPGRLQQIGALLVTGAMLWYTLPDHRRQLIMMKTTRGMQRVLSRAARRQGRAGMSEELSGRPAGAARCYTTAAQFARVSDALGKALESMRP